MHTAIESTPIPTGRRVAANVLGGLAILFLLWDGVIKLMQIAPVVESFERLGYPSAIAPVIGALELVCLALYVVPRASVVGAVLLTGFLGGAVSTHVRVGDPLVSHVFFPLYVGAFVWGALLLRDARLRALLAPPLVGAS